jgi:hypothetical protein
MKIGRKEPKETPKIIVPKRRRPLSLCYRYYALRPPFGRVGG